MVLFFAAAVFIRRIVMQRNWSVENVSKAVQQGVAYASGKPIFKDKMYLLNSLGKTPALPQDVVKRRLREWGKTFRC